MPIVIPMRIGPACDQAARYRRISAATMNHGLKGPASTPSAAWAAHSNVSGLTAAVHNGGNGRCTGRGTTVMPSSLKCATGEAERHTIRGRAQDGQRLVDKTAAFCHPRAERRVLLWREAATDADLEPAAAKQVERRNALCHVHRMVIGERNDTKSESQARRAPRECRENQFRLRRVRVAGHEMMLGEPHAMEPERVRELDFGDAVLVHGRLTAPGLRRYGELIEEVEYQIESLVVFGMRSCRYIASDLH